VGEGGRGGVERRDGENNMTSSLAKIEGNKYRFEIVITNHKEVCGFSITAIDRKSLRYSSINNLNSTLSLLKVDCSKSKYEDSSWTLRRQEVERFSKVVKNALADENYLVYLENKLDEDRDCGEWENRIKNRK
jgi:hypothetical protein